MRLWRAQARLHPLWRELMAAFPDQSVDSAVASAVVALLSVVHSPWWLAAYAMTVAVCWSRVALRYHTVAQTVAGASLGAATAAGFWLL